MENCGGRRRRRKTKTKDTESKNCIRGLGMVFCPESLRDSQEKRVYM